MGAAMRLVMIDNYDSFTYNLVQLFYEFDLEVLVFRHDEIDLAGIAALQPRLALHLAGSQGPGPGRHQQNGHRPFLSTNSHPGSLPGTSGPQRSLRRRHRQGPHPGARQTPPGFSSGDGACLRACRRLSGPPAITPSWRSPTPRNWKSPPGPKTASSWACNTAPFPSTGSSSIRNPSSPATARHWRRTFWRKRLLEGGAWGECL